MRHPRWLVVLALAAAAAACGGAGEERSSSAPDTAAGVGAATPRTAPGDTAPAGDAPAGDAPADRAPPGSAGADTAWTRSPVRHEDDGTMATVTAARTGTHDRYDRFVLEFAERVPSYTVRYPTRPLHQCGSGNPIDPGAPAALQIELRPAVAHDEQGSPTVTDRSRAPALPALRTARLTCDFEGIVEWVLGVTEPTGFRVMTLSAPPRLVVDVRHP